ncbi:hypothetical protein [Clostridium chromiireducens]|nr:hypothetical protein [Clostridium chromiireducens]
MLTVYSLAVCQGYIIEFEANYEISATAFDMEGRMNFVDRMAG